MSSSRSTPLRDLEDPPPVSTPPSAPTGLARRMSPKLNASSFSSSYPPRPTSSTSSSFSLASSFAPSSASQLRSSLLPTSVPSSTAASASSATASAVRALLCVLCFAALLALLSIALDHLAFTGRPLAICSDPTQCPTALTRPPAPPVLSTEAAVQREDSASPGPPPPEVSPPSPPSPPPPHPSPAVRAGPPFLDSAASLLSCPPLASILGANRVRVETEERREVEVDVQEERLKAAIAAYEADLQQRLSAAALHHWDWQQRGQSPTSSDTPLTMAAYYASRPSSNVTTRSVRNDDYTISVWSNVCLTVGGEKDPHVVLLGEDTEANQRWVDDVLLQQQHGRAFAWMPRRYCNDQARLSVRAKAADEWLWIPAEEGRGVFHQLEWDFNVGHQFHQQVLPLYTAITAHELFHHPMATALLIDGGCADAQSSMGVRHGAWKGINQFLGRVAVEGVKERVAVLRRPCDAAGQVGLCFERLLLNDPSDQYLDRGQGDSSFESFRRYRALLLHQLRLSPPPFPADPATSSLRVTIYSRHDSSRRRILNVAALTAALAPHHIVRHVPDFGSRPPQEQLALYAHTDLLIAPHGAHMTFAFVLPEKGLVAEVFAHEEGKFSWTVNFLAATNHRHLQQVGIADFPGHTPLDKLEKGLRHMDRDFHVNLTTLCIQLRSIQVPITYTC